MTSTKLSVTLRRRLTAKYSKASLKKVDAAIAAWIAADAARGFRTIHVALDDPAALAAFGVPAVTSESAEEVKQVVDGLVAATAPDYIVIIGADDVVPMFRVANPTFSDDPLGDSDPDVPTDNPYTCSTPFEAQRTESYLVPDRVVGRIPDLPGSTDPSWLVDYLTAATAWVGVPAATYAKPGLSVCCARWRPSGLACLRELGVATSELFVSPPSSATTPALKQRHKSLRHMIKCHGENLSSAFVGEGGPLFPTVLQSPGLAGRIRPGTVAAAMCCYGAQVFDPQEPAALHAGEPPIASTYLRQGAHGFLGSTGLSWVGDASMMCADWVVTAFLRHSTTGASLGRAALEAKQDLLRWLQSQGKKPDRADEKTLLQFQLLGDPSIHPAIAPAPPGAPTPAGPVAATTLAVHAGTSARRGRRRMRHDLGKVLREGLPTRRPAAAVDIPAGVATAAREAMKRFEAPVTEASATPIMVEHLAQQAAPVFAGAPVLAGAGLAAPMSDLFDEGTYQYCWAVSLGSNGVRRVGMVVVQADASGQVTDQRTVVSC